MGCESALGPHRALRVAMTPPLTVIPFVWLCLLVACGADSPSSTPNRSPPRDAGIRDAAITSPQDADADLRREAGTIKDATVVSPPDAESTPEAGLQEDVKSLVEGSRSALSVPLAEDLNPDPDVIEINLRAQVANVEIGSQSVQMYTFNGQVPGPRIEGKVGDRLVVHFTNRLPVDTMIHWHGVRVPNAMDGTPLVQAGVKPGGTFNYVFDLTDPGIYWYHPHLDSSEQLLRGLYAPIIVHAPDEPENLGEELALVFSDVAFSSPGIAGFPEKGNAMLAEGRDGTVVLVNGKEPRTLLVQPNARLRLRLLNAAANRYFKLRLEGHKLTRIGSEGGLSAAPVEMFQLLLANAERADVLVTPKGKAGDRVSLVALPYDRGTGATADPEVLLTLQLVGHPAATPPGVPAVLRSIEALPAAGATEVSIKIEREANDYMVNGASMGEAPAVVGHVGEVQHWRVSNVTYYDHPMHIHGFFFQVVNPLTHEPVAPLEWRDTVNVPQSGQLELLVRYDNRPGMWMYHCHILDHVEMGLMGMLHVH